jgi:hypothetical protein
MHMDSYVCELCIYQKVEKLRHLFFRCPFAKNCWNAIGVQVPHWFRPDRATKRIKRSLDKPFAMEIIILMCWCIWSSRNAWLFSNEASEVQRCIVLFKSEFAMVIHRSKR